MKVLIDMNLSPGWAGFLHDAGLEAVHWIDVGPADAADAAIMDHARKGGFVVLTHDLDFGTILAASGGVAPSVVQIRADDLRTEAIGRHVVGALRQADEALAEGALVTVHPARTRISILPIGSRY